MPEITGFRNDIILPILGMELGYVTGEENYSVKSNPGSESLIPCRIKTRAGGDFPEPSAPHARPSSEKS